MRAHEVSYRISGESSQVVEIELDPGETVIAEAGAMIYLEKGIGFETRMGDGTESLLGKLWSAGKRKLTGESVFLTHFTNDSEDSRHVAFSAPFPGAIVPLHLDQLGGEVLCQREAFLAAAFGTEIDVAFTRRLTAGFFGGEGFILQCLKGDGLAFVHCGGSVIHKQLNEQTLMVDTGCLVAFSTGIEYGIKMVRSLKSMLFGGEGLFLATLEGTGHVWIQSNPFSRVADRILEFAPLAGGRQQGED